ncbi:coagulation factor XIII A chain-like [Triplophysa rosa]|uniref:coagulation factor XIII A chain-like n=1 Tax=Triplophysa rosa TaxID=992332 RepID=UPI002545E7F6|nr:coagulation factor XIII A chain-like [Triplophysa rosa]
MRIADNKKVHNTGRFKNSNLIVRRNKEFIIDIRFNRPFNKMQDNVEVEFLIGELLFEISFKHFRFAKRFHNCVLNLSLALIKMLQTTEHLGTSSIMHLTFCVVYTVCHINSQRMYLLPVYRTICLYFTKPVMIESKHPKKYTSLCRSFLFNKREINVRYGRDKKRTPFSVLANDCCAHLTGGSPNENRGTYIIVSFGKDIGEMIWKCRVLNTQGNDVTVGITPDPSCIVGRFRTFVAVVSGLGKQRTPKNPDTDVYVLFNAWDPADQVYLSKESDRQEYVLNDVGVIYNGEFNNMSSRPWNYGQFEEGVLDACLLVLDAGKVPLVYRGNATEVVRQGSALMNSQDDDGVLVGNWSGDYSIGTSPTAWTGSTEILLKYAREGGVPVCFAQCWGFAGVLNTFLRCLGIPARVITNYCSAHDNTGNLKTDIMLDEDGKVNKSRTRDSVWNYHCWNEVYMTRPDLPQKFSGWQVVDCTPQETSDGLYRCGPTSVSAIKDGELSYPFDAKFVFAELNSDVIYHQIDKYGKTKILHVDTAYVGKLIVTKRINSNQYEDITSNYKYPEGKCICFHFQESCAAIAPCPYFSIIVLTPGSKSDKQSMQMAESRGVPLRDYEPPAEAGVDIQLQADTVKMGEDFKLTMYIKNQSSKRCTIDATITGSVVFYTGVTSTTIKQETRKATVEAWKTEKLLIDIRATEYMPHLVEQSNLLFVVKGSIEETGASLTTMRVVTLRTPELTIRVSGSPRVGKAFTVIVEFRNPYNFALENVQFRLDSPGLIKTKFKSYKYTALRISYLSISIDIQDQPIKYQIPTKLYLNTSLKG